MIFRHFSVPSRVFGWGLVDRRPATLHFIQITKSFGLMWETKAKEDA